MDEGVRRGESYLPGLRLLQLLREKYLQSRNGKRWVSSGGVSQNCDDIFEKSLFLRFVS